MPTCWWYELYCFLQYLYVVKLKGGVALEGNVVTILEFWNEKKKKKTTQVRVPCDHLKFPNLEIMMEVLRRNEIFERMRGRVIKIEK